MNGRGRRQWRHYEVLSVYAALALGCGCNVKASPAQSSRTDPTARTRSLAVASAPPPREKPWFVGKFAGQYSAQVAPVEVKTGAVREWAADDGKLASGPGKLTLRIDDAGLVNGASEGALGASHATGVVDGDTLRVSLAPEDSGALRGVLVAMRTGDGFKGFIDASTGDSLTVRRASVELAKQTD